MIQRTFRPLFPGIAFALTAFVCAAGTTSAEPLFRITDLDTLGGATSSAFGINELGQVVGQAEDASGMIRPFVWESGMMQGMDLPAGYSGRARAWNINNSGRITGRAWDRPVDEGGTGNNAGFTWTVEDGFTVLDVFDGVAGNAYELNDAGQVVGNARLPGDENSRGYLWSPDGTVIDLGTFTPGSGFGGFDGNSFATGINNLGQVTGSAGGTDSHSDDTAFLWTEQGGMQDLGTLPGYALSFAQSINDHTQIVGGAYTSGFADGTAVLWEDGAWHDLGTLGGDRGFAIAINELGQVVGSSKDAAGVDRAFLWKEGTMHDLNSLLISGDGWELTNAYDINDHGQIVGAGLFGGEERAFLLTPVPEPGSLALLVVGGTGLLVLRRRK